MRWAVLLTVLGAAAARAETGWLTAQGRLPEASRVSLFGGFSSVGAGVVVPTAPERTLAVEASWDLLNRFAEARLTRAWQLTGPRFATLSGTFALNVFAVPAAPLALGAGAHGGLNLSLGRGPVRFDLALDLGAEGFSAGPSRVPVRLGLGLEVKAGPVVIAALARTGADVFASGSFAVRGEAVLALGWSFDAAP